MTIEERKQRILDKIVEIKSEGQAEADALRQQFAELDTAYAEGVQSV